jgi:hypothetical protein
MTASKPRGIFCVEADWSSDLTDRASVRDMLELLESVDDIPFIHEHINSSKEAFFSALGNWTHKRYARYSIGYFASHGRPGKLLLGRKSVSLEDVAAALEGRCAGRILYFGSCSVLRIEDERLRAFRERTGAEAIVGFTRDVGWVASAALDMILLEALANNPEEAAVERWLRKEYGALPGHLGLRMVYG